MAVGQSYTIHCNVHTGNPPPLIGQTVKSSVWSQDEHGEWGWNDYGDPTFEITNVETVIEDEEYILIATMLTDGILPQVEVNQMILIVEVSDLYDLSEDVSLVEEETAELMPPVPRKIRLISFTYSKDIAYTVELGNQYMRFFYGDDVLLDENDDEIWIETPYLTQHLFELQYHQVGDVMWITHPLYNQRKLTRTSETDFALTIIPFTRGPFLTRNDLIDPDNPSTITMTSSVTGEPIGTAEYDITGHGSNHIKNNWWDGIASHGVDGQQSDYCGGGRKADGRPVYLTYTVTYADPIALLTEINIDYICASHEQTADLTLNEHTKRGLRVYDSVAGTWTEVIDPETIDATFPATANVPKPSSLIGYDGTAQIIGSWTNVTKIEIYLYATASSHSTACAVFNVSAGTEAYIPGTLTASSDYFQSCMVGSLFKIIHQRTVTVITLNNAGYSPALYTKGTFRFVTHGTWTGTVELQRNDNGAGWDTYRTYISKKDRNIQESFVEDGENVQYRIYAHAGMTSGFSSDLTLDDVFREGIVRIVSLNETYPATVANISVITPLAFAIPTKRWAEGAWNDCRGFPVSITFFEDRCIYGGMQTILPSGAKLLTCWLSETGDYENFDAGVNADNSFSVTVPSENDIMWLDALESLVIGTSGDEWRIGSNRMEQPITPTNFSVRQQSSYGSAYIQAIRVNDQILFVDFVGRKVRELAYNGDKYIAPDLTSLAEHITLSGIVDMAVQKNPDSIVWCVLDNGSLVAMVYEKEQNIVAWSKIPIDGIVHSVCVSGGEDEDDVWLAIERTIIGATLTYANTVNNVTSTVEIVTYEGETVTDVEYNIYIEKFAPRVFGTLIEDAYFVDCGITFESAIPTTTVSGLTHLIGETVAVLADGLVQTSKVVDENGEIELDTAASKVQVGKSYRSKLMPMRMVHHTQLGSSQGLITRVPKMSISFLNTMGAKYGASDAALFDINWTDPKWENSEDSIEGLFTGEITVSVNGGFSVQEPIIVSTEAPLPCVVRSLMPRLEITGT